MAKGKLYLIPTPIGDRPVWDVLPASNRTVIDSIDYFIVEDIRSARRFLSKAGISRPIDSLRFAELNEHTAPAEVSALFAPLLTGTDAGVLSEAGLPGVADPGADAVALAHIHGIEVVPLVGPSSILLALMASGLNGQSFAFNGYLPIRQPDRNKAIRHFEARAQSEHQSQIFIEAPYRNLKLYEDFCTACRPQTRLTIAADLLQPDQLIRTRTIGQWRKEQKPDIQNVRPSLFSVDLFPADQKLPKAVAYTLSRTKHGTMPRKPSEQTNSKDHSTTLRRSPAEPKSNKASAVIRSIGVVILMLEYSPSHK